MTSPKARRKLRFGDRVKKLWQRVERPGAFVLVGFAFAMQTVGLAFNQPTATQVAAIVLSLGIIMIISMVAEIHDASVSESEGRSYLEFDSIVPKVRDRLRRVAKGRSPKETIDVKLIGLTLRNQWKIVESFLKELDSDSSEVRVNVSVVHLDPEWDALEKLNNKMPPMARALRTAIEQFVDDYEARFSDGQWSLNLYGLEEFPLVAGILIDRSYLYRTLCDVEHGKRVTQGEGLYEFFEYREPGEEFDHQTVEHFERIFEYYANRLRPLSQAGAMASSHTTA